MIDFDEYDPFGPEAGFVRIEPCTLDKVREYVADNNMTEFKKLVEKLKESNNEQGIKECFGYVIAENCTAFIQELVEVQGFKPTLSECDTAMKHGQFETLDYLLSHGADPHEDDDMLIHLAAGYNQVKALEVLAKHGANNYTPIINDFIYTIQTQAAMHMLEHGAEPNTNTLERAAKIEDLTILKYLLTDKGMVPSKEFIQEMPPLFIEAKHLLTKAYQKHSFQKKMPPKANSQSRGMKI